ncbi:MAG TPA: hypothetical protein VHR66_05640 [Gemmataceae bacterium]|jgi:hypothetical protein|nr:hypothetical protein [Gemmataceae bacterium]
MAEFKNRLEYLNRTSYRLGIYHMVQSFHPSGDSRRRAMFAALVAFQDRGLSVSVSRKFVSSRFDVSAAEVVRAERDGLAEHWPPLVSTRIDKALAKASKITATGGPPSAK